MLVLEVMAWESSALEHEIWILSEIFNVFKISLFASNLIYLDFSWSNSSIKNILMKFNLRSSYLIINLKSQRFDFVVHWLCIKWIWISWSSMNLNSWANWTSWMGSKIYFSVLSHVSRLEIMSWSKFSDEIECCWETLISEPDESEAWCTCD